MVVSVVVCPFCHLGEHVVKHGTNRCGTSRCRCLACLKSFTPNPKSRSIDETTQAAIERAIQEKMAWNAIKRTFSVSWETINKIAQKKQANLPLP
jgi:transposase-like protein